jgi:hypothetical protein
MQLRREATSSPSSPSLRISSKLAGVTAAPILRPASIKRQNCLTIPRLMLEVLLQILIREARRIARRIRSELILNERRLNHY